jgi:hypothetical protein
MDSVGVMDDLAIKTVWIQIAFTPCHARRFNDKSWGVENRVALLEIKTVHLTGLFPEQFFIFRE